MNEEDLDVYKPFDKAEILQMYEEWVTDDRYLVFKRVDYLYSIGGYRIKNAYVATKAAKRGNNIYCRRVRGRVGEFCANLPDYDFFDENAVSYTNSTTPALFITLTYSRVHDFHRTWEDLGKDLNRFLSRIKRKYGKISHVRVFEGHKDGYPHVHAIILFKEQNFRIDYRQKGRNGYAPFRVKRDERDVIKDCWPCGYSDVQGISNLQSAVSYACKYMTKTFNPASGEGVKSSPSRELFAMTWHFKKRLFSFSKDFSIRLDTPKHNSNKNSRFLQTNLSGEVIEETKYVFCGIYKAELFKFIGKPPPRIDLGRKMPEFLREDPIF